MLRISIALHLPDESIDLVYRYSPWRSCVGTIEAAVNRRAVTTTREADFLTSCSNSGLPSLTIIPLQPRCTSLEKPLKRSINREHLSHTILT